MHERIEAELQLLRNRFPDMEYRPDGHWFRIPSYSLPEGWNRKLTEVAFLVPVGYPGTPPYGIYAPLDLLFNGARPDNFVPAPNPPPFVGSWGIFSWTPAEGQWRPTADLQRGSNLLNFVMSFGDRFREGK